MTRIYTRYIALGSACVLAAATLALVVVAHTEAAAHPYYNVCQVSPLANGIKTVDCHFLAPPGYSQADLYAKLNIHSDSAHPQSTHDWAYLPATSAWDSMSSQGQMGTYCPQVNIKALCSKSQGTWNSPLTYEQGWYALALSYVRWNGSGNTPDLYCPSDRPYMLNANTDTQMFW